MPLSPPEFAHYRDLRRSLHRHPEIAYEEHRTAQAIRAELTRLDIPYLTGPASAPTATIAFLGTPDATRCVALRADIDALPITEASQSPHVSTIPGRMHACGHDGHIANLLATAAVLKRTTLPPKTCIKLIFQPAEEGGAGAERLVRAGVLDGRIGPRVDAIYGLHGYPGLPLGTVSTRPGPLMASTDTLSVTFRGMGCHGAFPHLGRDPLLAAAEAVVSLQSFVSREINPTDAAVLTIGIFNAGTATNVIPGSASFAGTVRTLSDSTRRLARDAITRRCTHIALAAGCTAEIGYEEGYPCTHNHPAHADLVARLAAERFGPERYLPCAAPVMGGEDFAYYLEKVPGAFFFVGLCPPDVTDYPPLHSDRFDFVDDSLHTGVEMFLALTHEALK
jgi:amidohydrolase